MSPASQAAVTLGLEMRRLRARSGKSGTAVAADVGVGQATISRYENGEAVPSFAQVRAYAASVDAPANAVELLLGLAGTALDRKTFGDHAAGAGLAAIQADVGDIENGYRALLHFQPALIPGLLQIPGYARAVAQLTRRARDDADIEQAVLAKVARQAILADKTRRFGFLITEAALRWRPRPLQGQALRAQLHQVAATAAMPDLNVGLIPADRPVDGIPAIGFVLHDDPRDGRSPIVQYDLPDTVGYVTDEPGVEMYRDLLDRLGQSAVYGETAFEFAEELARKVT